MWESAWRIVARKSKAPKSTGLVWFGLVWFGLVWFGLVWFGLVWFGLVWIKTSDGVIGTHWQATLLRPGEYTHKGNSSQV
jgi:hypothetical protein